MCVFGLLYVIRIKSDFCTSYNINKIIIISSKVERTSQISFDIVESNIYVISLGPFRGMQI